MSVLWRIGDTGYAGMVDPAAAVDRDSPETASETDISRALRDIGKLLAKRTNSTHSARTRSADIHLAHLRLPSIQTVEAS